MEGSDRPPPPAYPRFRRRAAIRIQSSYRAAATYDATLGFSGRAAVPVWPRILVLAHISGMAVLQGNWTKTDWRNKQIGRQFRSERLAVDVLLCGGESIRDLLNREVDPTRNVLGNFWLERGTYGTILGSTGIGKLVLAIQIGLKPFRPQRVPIKVAEPLKVLGSSRPRTAKRLVSARSPVSLHNWIRRRASRSGRWWRRICVS